MNTESSTSTKGGSAPRISPELLWFESHAHGAPDASLVLPNGDVAFVHRGRVYAMPEREWSAFKMYQAAA